MRISDWSSDVCSSDLRKGQDREHAGDGEVARHRQGVHAADGKGHQSQQVTEQYEHEERKDVRGVEIGGASCRERESQYVKNSVVAVSLKKKNKEKKQNEHSVSKINYNESKISI